MDVVPDLNELCRIHDVSLELIRHSDDVDDLLDRVLGEYERRLKDMSAATLDSTRGPETPEEAKKLRALVMFAGHAVALKEKAAAASELKQRSTELERLNVELESALNQEERARRRLDDVLAALDAGVLVVGSDGRIHNTNRAASELTGVPADQLVGSEAARFLGDVERGSDGEVTERGPGDGERTVLVARRNLNGDTGSEVVLLSDVTQRDREVEERHRLERFAELLRTLSVLSHKINNPLTSLMGRAQLLKMKKGIDPSVDKAAEVIEDSAKRIATYIRELALVVKEGREKALQRALDMDGESGAPGKEAP